MSGYLGDRRIENGENGKNRYVDIIVEKNTRERELERVGKR